MKIILNINDKDKTFIAPFIGARKLKETLALSTKVQKNEFDDKLFDELAEFLVSIYGNQFTFDELLDGYPSDQFFTKAFEDMAKITGDFEGKVKN